MIDRVSNESVGFPVLKFAVCVTNFVAAGFLLKNRSFNLQTTSDIFARHVQAVYLGYSASLFLIT